ncbi:MFS transporter [Halalkalibacter nanhaiisediminis]|uniref:Sugar phosphate permease n=1 Tax=Halalkalibacter nanhaiisediminis TaxID=688079 RepID=A0A562QD91_9BACI|nr:MFS transporter [Halalkalibacter nanhaiisediminis]TWI54727.1 sugar phosphate permease [Halalkalibacter nanhaiisediminis]
MRNIHKGWIILILLFFTMLGSLGFGRFSMGAILPFMREGLALDYRQMGFIASSAFIGYLISVSIIGYFVIRFNAKTVINYSLLIICVGMVVCANATSFWLAYGGCLLLGLGSGGSSIPAMGLAGRWFSNEKKGMAIGFAMGGLGLGIVISGLVVPLIINVTIEGWRVSWYILTVITMSFIMLNWLFLKNSPEEAGLEPIGNQNVETRQSVEREHAIKSDKWAVYRNKQVWMIGFIYLSWGFSYLIFSTFLVDYLMNDVGYSEWLEGLFFFIAGLVSIVSGFIRGGISDKFGRMFALSLVLTIQFLMLMALSVSTSAAFIFVEVILYGFTLWAVPTIMNASVSEFVPLMFVPVAMGFVTIFFSVGQIISPIVMGVLIESTNSYFGAFLLSAFISLFGAIGCMRLHSIQRTKQLAKMRNEGLEV